MSAPLLWQRKCDEKEQTMADKDPKVVKQESSQTLTDEQIITERKMPRRSFLTAAGALLVGAAALASGVRAVAQQGSDPDSKKATDPDTKDKKKGDPDSKKGADPGSKKRKKTDANTADPDSKAAADADSKDRKKSGDPNSKGKAADPQSKRAAKAKAKTPPKSDPDGARY
ncbi:MAG: hypothetical protein ACRD33_08440 [Candidatus Acidiferrales bacterium]